MSLTKEDRVLPEIRRRTLKKPAQDRAGPVRPVTSRCGQQAMRAEEVRRKGCPVEVPEVLPLMEGLSGSSEFGYCC
jgi:hypothetical protein